MPKNDLANDPYTGWKTYAHRFRDNRYFRARELVFAEPLWAGTLDEKNRPIYHDFLGGDFEVCVPGGLKQGMRREAFLGNYREAGPCEQINYRIESESRLRWALHTYWTTGALYASKHLSRWRKWLRLYGSEAWLAMRRARASMRRKYLSRFIGG